MSRVLHGYFRSSAAYRVRIALNLKGLACERVSVHLRKGEQRADAFLALNPQGMVPALLDGDALLTQSPAILEYLDEAYPDTPRLLPDGAVDRARVRALAAAVACDIHPLNNLRVLQYIQGPLGCSPEAMATWYNHWIAEGFRALERMPQVFNSARHALDLAPYPTIRQIAEACNALEAFQDAHPSRQPDAE